MGPDQLLADAIAARASVRNRAGRSPTLRRPGRRPGRALTEFHYAYTPESPRRSASRRRAAPARSSQADDLDILLPGAPDAGLGRIPAASCDVGQQRTG